MLIFLSLQRKYIINWNLEMITDNSRQTLAQLFSMTPNNPLGEESRKDRDCNDEPMNPNNLLQYSSELRFRNHGKKCYLFC